MNWVKKGKGRKGIKSQPEAGIVLHFLAVDGKAIARYAKQADAPVEVQVTSREHAVKLAEKAVASANNAEVSFRVDHGVMDFTDPMNPSLSQTCLSLEAYEAVKAIERKAKHNRLFEIAV